VKPGRKNQATKGFHPLDNSWQQSHKKPFIFSNLAITLDGKIASSDGKLFSLGTKADKDQMQVIRKKADVIINGASSLRAVKTSLRCRLKKKQPANAVLSRDFKGFSPKWEFFQDKEIQRFFFATGELGFRKEKELNRSGEVIHLKKPSKKNSLARQIIKELAERGYRNILVEGGGTLMWEFVKENWISEYHVTLTPRILGGSEAPTLVDGQGFINEQILDLRLKKQKRVGDEIYLTYVSESAPQSI
jgi:riboflavin-specific deaminase-like protein